MITFWRGKTKVRVPTHPRATTGKELTSLYAESVNMLEGLADEEVDEYLEENPKSIPLFEIDVAEAVSPYISQPEDAGEEPDREAIRELRQAQEALEREMAISRNRKMSMRNRIEMLSENYGKAWKPVKVQNGERG